MELKKVGFFFIVLIFFLGIASAHCPLCTIGAGAAAGAAAWLGVSKVVIGLFIGAFAMSMGIWFARWADKKKRIIPFQKITIVVLVFLTTVLPLLPVFKAIGPLYIPFIGAYGTTYAFNYSLASSFLGGAIVLASPSLSRRVTKLRKGKFIPFQGAALTLLSLIIVGLVIQLLI